MSEQVILIFGASGIIGRALVQNLSNASGCRVLAASRRPEESLSNNVVPYTVDLNDLKSANFEPLASVTHMVYTAYVDKPTWEEQRQPNTDMFRHALEIVVEACPNLSHVTLLQGTKAYGAHLGPFKTPAKESDPRIPNGYFYDDQFDIMVDQARKANWTWTVLRPHVVIGPAFRSPLNLITVLGVYCSLLKVQGRPLVFPGPTAAFNALYQATDAGLLSRAISWSGRSSDAADEVFNITNGDYFRWRYIWPKIAASFDMEMGGIEQVDLECAMRGMEPLWRELSTTHDLVIDNLSELVSWSFANYVFGTTWDVMSDSTKIRRHGFHEMLDSEKMFMDRLDQLRVLKVIPS